MEKSTRAEFSYVIFFLAILCGYVFRLLPRNILLPGDVFMGLDVLRSAIYMELVLYWISSVKKRILYSAVRKYLLMIGYLLIFWLFIRTIKYLFLGNMDFLKSLCWYGFYIPMLFIPLFALYLAVCLGQPEHYRLPKYLYSLVFPAVVLCLLVLTNHIHQCVFRFENGVPSSDGNYYYGWGYKMILAWLSMEVLIFFVLLFIKSHVPGRKKRIWLPMIPLGVGILYVGLYLSGISFLRTYAGDLTVMMILVILAICEGCIKSGLIPSNTGYEELFEATTIGAQILNQNKEVCFASGNAKQISENVLEEAKNRPIDLGEEQLLLAPVRGGAVVWCEDVTDIRCVLKQLEAKAEQLESSRSLLQAEVDLKKKQSKLDEQMQFCNKITEYTKDQIDQIKYWLENSKNEKQKWENLKKICVLAAYVKRMSNLILLCEESDFLPAKELEYCLRESVENLKVCKIAVSLSGKCEGVLKKQDLIALYETYEKLMEQILGDVDAVLLHLQSANRQAVLKLNIAGNTRCLSHVRDIAVAGNIQIRKRIQNEECQVQLYAGKEIGKNERNDM